MRNTRVFFLFAILSFNPIILANPAALYLAPTPINQLEVQTKESNTAKTNEEKKVIKAVKSAINSADRGVSKLTDDILAIDGMSSNKVRHLLNNLCASPGTHYLEIGCWKGSTFVSALYRNKQSILSASAIDNWSQFSGPFQDFWNNCNHFIAEISFQFSSSDCFSLDLARFIENKINIYFYDGRHREIDQEQAFTYYNPIFEDVFIAVVDDWNWEPARLGTFSAFDKLGYQILFEAALPAQYNGDRNLWWHGIYVAVIRKSA